MPNSSLRFASGLLVCGFALLAGGMLTLGKGQAQPNVEKPAKTTLALQWEEKKFPNGILYALKVPIASPYKLIPMMSGQLAGVASPFWQTIDPAIKPLFIINGGYFDPGNHLTTSYVFQKGTMTGDPHLNEHLTSNPAMAPYLPKIYNRTEFRVYLCKAKSGGFQTRYDIVPRSEAVPGECILQDSVGAGPALLPKVDAFEEGFVDYNAQGKVTRDPVGICAKNARSAVGLTAQGDVIVLMGSQIPANPKGTGFSLSDMSALFKARGAVKAMSLDGGSSSGLVYEGKPIYGKFNADGTPVKRPVKSVLVVAPQ